MVVWLMEKVTWFRCSWWLCKKMLEYWWPTFLKCKFLFLCLQSFHCCNQIRLAFLLNPINWSHMEKLLPANKLMVLYLTAGFYISFDQLNWVVNDFIIYFKLVGWLFFTPSLLFSKPPQNRRFNIGELIPGIVLSWSMNLTTAHSDINSYWLYAYQESTNRPSVNMWKKVGDVKALPLPMACTLTQFIEGHQYHFAVCAIDVHKRFGPFSKPGTILLIPVTSIK